MAKKVLTAAQKEKVLKRICGEKLIEAWEWGAREFKAEILGPSAIAALDICRRGKRSRLRSLVRKLKQNGVLPL